MNFLKTILLVLTIGSACFSKAKAQSEAIFFTSMGTVTIALTDSLTPVTVDSFMARVAEKFYDGVLFHRVIDGFMIQGGDPTGTGTGGPGYTIPDEFHPSLKNVAGALAMANIGTPNTGGCQFFINLVSNTHLNNKHTVFGKVTNNFSVVQAIGKVATDSNDRPLMDVVIDSIRITKFPSGIMHISGNIQAPVYPNPSHGLFNIDLPGMLTKVEIVNMHGQVVYHTETVGNLKVDLQNLSTGLYILRVANTMGKSETKLLIQ